MAANITFPQELPILDVLKDIRNELTERDELVLQAPPGAGKTTVVPLALIDASWLAGKRVLMLEPRRIAAKNAAERMANLLGEKVGKTVGYRVRLDSKVSEHTRIEVITEGILARMLNDDPSLDDVGLVIFDEFHERSLDADLGLALTLQARRLFRSPEDGETPLKLLVMSATLDDARIASLISKGDTGDAKIVKSEGRQYPVKLVYCQAWQAGENVIPRVVACVKDVIRGDEGSVLVFLPGQKEIHLVAESISDYLSDQAIDDVLLSPLYGDLSLSEQRIAVSSAPEGKRKIVIATAIAESSLTIEGVTVVVDSGLSRSAVFDPRTGMTRLHTKRLSKSSSIQRMGRAGRMAPGVCYRLWSESQQGQLTPFTAPEILQADLAPLALSCLSWGIENPEELDWLDLPPQAQYSQALDLLALLGAIEKKETGNWSVTKHGHAMANFPAHPRLAHLLIKGQQLGLSELASNIAALIGESDPLGPDSGADIRARLNVFDVASKGHQRLKKQSKQFRRLLSECNEKGSAEKNGNAKDERWIGYLLACAYPDRIACRRSSTSHDYVLSNGRAAQLRSHDSMQKCEWVVVADVGGQKTAAKDQIFLASELDPTLFDKELDDLISTQESIDWDEKAQRFRAELQRKVGRLVVSREALPEVNPEQRAKVLVGLIRKKGLGLLPWTEDIEQWRARVAMLRSKDSETWPDLSNDALLDTLEDWLSPYLNDVSHINHFARLDLMSILHAMLPWPLPQQMEEFAPQKIKVPSGSTISIDYSQNPPVLAVRLQEMFGCTDTPKVAQGKIPLMIHLLSPARRPLAVTQDLGSFWRNAYVDVKKDMKGRYPKHYWPDDPLVAEATSRAKPRNV